MQGNDYVKGMYLMQSRKMARRLHWVDRIVYMVCWVVLISTVLAVWASVGHRLGWW